MKLPALVGNEAGRKSFGQLGWEAPQSGSKAPGHGLSRVGIPETKRR